MYHTMSSFYPDIILLSSFASPEASVLLHMANKCHSLGYNQIPIVTLDTGRLPQETHNYIDQVRERYDMVVDVLFPDGDAVSKMVAEKGPNLFYDSVENRLECCQIRKVDVLDQYIRKNKVRAYYTGLRRMHGVDRKNTPMIEHTQASMPTKPIKKNPMVDWSTEEVWEYIKLNDIPVNKLNKMGYPSIGCAPCSRSVSAGEDSRSGRWWWENEDTPKECGLHNRELLFEKGSGI